MQAVHNILGEAGFTRQDAAHYAGHVRGYPVFATVIPTEAGLSLLVAFRHHIKNPETLALNSENGPELRALVASGRAKLSTDEYVAWLEWDKLDGLSTAKLSTVLSEVAAELDRSHGRTAVESCQHCQAALTAFPDFSDGRVRRSCAACAEKQRIETECNNRLDPANVPLLAVVVVIGALLTAFSWSILWALYHEVFVWLGIDSIRVPHVVFIIVGVFISAGIAIPGSLLLRQVRRRGLIVGSLAGASATFVGILLGEVLLSAWLLYRETGSTNPVTAIIGAFLLWKMATLSYTVMKVAVALLATVFAFNIGKPGTQWIGSPLKPESNGALA